MAVSGARASSAPRSTTGASTAAGAARRSIRSAAISESASPSCRSISPSRRRMPACMISRTTGAPSTKRTTAMAMTIKLSIRPGPCPRQGRKLIETRASRNRKFPARMAASARDARQIAGRREKLHAPNVEIRPPSVSSRQKPPSRRLRLMQGDPDDRRSLHPRPRAALVHRSPPWAASPGTSSAPSSSPAPSPRRPKASSPPASPPNRPPS